MNKPWGPFERRPNLILIITDQQRSLQHYPAGWSERNLPWMTHLQQTGVTFERGMASATACSPSRSTLFTGTYPTVNGVLKVNDTLSLSRTLPMGGSLTTLGRLLGGAGYQMAYKGKWHLDSSFVSFSNLRPADHDRKMIEDDAFETRIAIEDRAMDDHYSFAAWTSPELGTSASGSTDTVEPGSDSGLNSLGGGVADNDARIVRGPLYASQQRSAVEFLREYDPASEPPFCLVVSMANPHDVWVYPFSTSAAGYDEQAWSGPEYRDLELPASYHAKLVGKPLAQKEWLRLFQGGPLPEDQALEYVRFYAYLQTLVDELTGDVLQALRSNQHVGGQLERDTVVVRLSDHGEMGMAQGGMRQKENNCYDESIQVPIILSNPLLPQGERRQSLVGLIDVMPTLAEIAGVDLEEAGDPVIQGRSFASELLAGPADQRKRFLFVTDDCSFTTTSIRTVVERDWKYAVYYKAEYTDGIGGLDTLNYNGQVSSGSVEYELYQTGPGGKGEQHNLLPTDGQVAAADPIVERWAELHDALTDLLAESRTLPDGWPTSVPPQESEDAEGSEDAAGDASSQAPSGETS